MSEEKLELSKPFLEKALKNYVLKIVFEKRDGTERTMYATRNQNARPDYQKKTSRVKKQHDHLLSVVDTEINEWRTININKIKSVEFTDRLKTITKSD